jgi:transketolase
MDKNGLEALARLVRYYILVSTTHAGSGHPTSSLSATELMTALLFGGIFRYDADRPAHPNNDRLIFSKGHASPLLYALWAAAGKVDEDELMTYRPIKPGREAARAIENGFEQSLLIALCPEAVGADQDPHQAGDGDLLRWV